MSVRGNILNIGSDNRNSGIGLLLGNLYLCKRKTECGIMENIIQIDSIDDYNRGMGLVTRHPLVTVVDTTVAKHRFNHVRLNYGLYAVFLKRGEGCRLRYGRRSYDYQDGTIVCLAPGQTVEVDIPDDAPPTHALGLLFHPDLIHGTSLGAKIGGYTFFDYSENEALHLSEHERDIITDCLRKIEFELSYPVDKHSRRLLCVQIEMVLDYCLRFYDRQFCTREKVNSDILSRFEQLLADYFNSGRPRREGLPSVAAFADMVCLSPGYFGDLIKRETGRTAKEYIQRKVISTAKQRLLGSADSVSEIAYDMGFQYPQHFTRLFKREVGCTPGEYREDR